MDVKSAFLYETIEEEVYVYQPPGFEEPDYPDKVYKVVKSLYGLHQAPRAWYETLANYLLENGFQKGKIDQTLFIKNQKGDILLVQVYVDDISFGSTNKELCKAFEKLMKDKFQMSSMGELTFFLGLQVKQKDDGIFISQDKYVAKILRKFGFTDVKSGSTPIETEKPLLKDPDGEDVNVHIYRKKVVVTEDVIHQDLQLDDANGVECLPTEEIFAELARMGYKKPPSKLTFYKAFFSAQWEFLIHTLVQCVNAKRTAWNEFSCSMASTIIYLDTDDLSSHTTRYTSPALTHKVFANMRRIGKGFFGIKTPLFATMLVQPHAVKEEKDEEDRVPVAPTPPSPIHAPSPPQAQPSPSLSPLQEQPTDTSNSSMTLLNTLIETCATLFQIVAHLKQDKIAQALEILKLNRRVKKLEKTRRSKFLGLKRGEIAEIDVDEDITLVDIETEVDLGAELQERKDDDNAANKEVNAAEPIVFDDEEVTMTMAQTLIKMKAEKERLLDEQMAKRLHDEEESFKKLKAVEVSGSESTQDTPTTDPKEISKKMFKICYKLSQCLSSRLKLYRLVKERFSTAVPTEDKEKALWVDLKRLFEPNAADVFWKLQRYMHDPLTWKLYTNCGVHQVSSTKRHDIFMLTEKDYPLIDVVMILMLSENLQVDEVYKMARDLVMKIFMEANKPKSRSLDTSSK
nr:putative ribonuclease H-like domain-containing protein [Tanacetum cinerariifolium]